MKNTTTRLLCGALLLLAGACSKNTIFIDTASGGSGGSGTTPTTALVTFQAAIESRNMTRALAPVRKDVRVAVYAYPAAAGSASGTPQAQGSYLSPTPGLLQGIDGFRMYLPTGSYNFYAVSDNTQFRPPVFADGQSGELLNGIDYLWWGGLQQDVTSAQAGIPIIFLHAATQVLFELQAGEGVKINQLALAHIFPPVEGAKMDLATGVIPPTATYEVKDSKMGVSGMLAQYTMLPVKSDTPLSVSFDVIINGETTPRTFSVQVPLPDGELRAGESYRFLAVIQGNEVTFPSVSVRNWVDVDETGKPLYPSEL